MTFERVHDKPIGGDDVYTIETSVKSFGDINAVGLYFKGNRTILMMKNKFELLFHEVLHIWGDEHNLEDYRSIFYPTFNTHGPIALDFGWLNQKACFPGNTLAELHDASFNGGYAFYRNEKVNCYCEKFLDASSYCTQMPPLPFENQTQTYRMSLKEPRMKGRFVSSRDDPWMTQVYKFESDEIHDFEINLQRNSIFRKSFLIILRLYV